ncbi:MAG: cobyrinate a,c-diamide synthase, partial [Synergistaceae bacterium]|nr:cobyrinate a,c-diamide synthase [Synergistaceae bacterium]
MKKILIAGASSRSGKTTVTCGLLAALKNRGLKVIVYKIGPDYIDTEYLRRSGSCEAFNLDTWLMTESRMRELFAQTSQGHDIAVIEGTMGLFDGGENGTAAIAKLLDAPVVLVLNVRSMGESAAALAMGFREYDKDLKLAGVILNFTGSSYHEQIISSALNKKGIKVFGALRRDEALKIPERHLGLVQAVENEKFNVERLRAKIESSVNVDELLRISIVNSSQTIVNSQPQPARPKFPARIAVAKDEAFTFRYAESERMLESLGAEIVKFSPIHDKKLPAADGYIFGGGYPEIFASELSSNTAMLASVKKCSRPIFAECGGMMYLCRNLNGV